MQRSLEQRIGGSDLAQFAHMHYRHAISACNPRRRLGSPRRLRKPQVPADCSTRQVFHGEAGRELVARLHRDSDVGREFSAALTPSALTRGRRARGGVGWTACPRYATWHLWPPPCVYDARAATEVASSYAKCRMENVVSSCDSSDRRTSSGFRRARPSCSGPASDLDAVLAPCNASRVRLSWQRGVSTEAEEGHV
jgi:hypothetical protein